ncbi:NADH:flavin oxidoreductase/NADH oxidase [Dyella flava]|uniref:NADH:flavin oxidoreductase/NADH oxidase n=1 Tax=Dyella flava TaxID=1920170 RepID=A0ABS2JZJ7_9GAMM|nr:NADH:flavin oxidoreductase/NADH oxidase [Dyella flava]MBM7124432.1 NADH:flavin oxidoreductase/NADH oxidase [Dyella flava]GLQ51907.1 NADH:flavin oxidoreductase / NADH oxidase [Dyella flava]
MSTPTLFTPVTIGEVTSKNRIMISPMCLYSAEDGVANDLHFVHLGKLAQGGAGIVMVEATAVTAQGRITHGDLGLWKDDQIAPLARIARFIRDNGAVPAIQLAHAGRKGSMQRPWYGNAALTQADIARGDKPWPVVGPSAIPVDNGYLIPHALDQRDLDNLREDFRAAARRALAAGFDIVELHFAHGYLLHQFLSPLSNFRNDAYGRDREGRMRFPLEVIEAVRAEWPAGKPLFVRVSAVDGVDGGITLEDTIAFAREAKARGVDMIDCSSGGLRGPATAARLPRGYGFQVPFAAAVRKEAGISSIAVGLILHPQQAEDIVAKGEADLVAIGREALFDPNWPLHAELELSGRSEGVFDAWPKQYGWWLERRESVLRGLQGPALPFRSQKGS